MIHSKSRETSLRHAFFTDGYGEKGDFLRRNVKKGEKKKNPFTKKRKEGKGEGVKECGIS